MTATISEQDTPAGAVPATRAVDELGALGAPPREVRVAIIGAGFAGLGAAIRLKQSGLTDFVLLERGNDVGGTWRDNSYPGCGCDVPSHLYSFSFAPNPDWSRAFSRQPEIQAYLRRCADDYGLRRHTYLGADVTEARWDSARRRWLVTTTRGELSCQVLIGAQGPLSSPSVPSLPGLETFQGTTFHSADWNHDYDLAGKRVAVIGTGASSIQFVPQLQKTVGHLTLFQRTAPWVMPRRDRAIRPWEKSLYRRIPAAQRALRAGIYWGRELMVLPLRGNQKMLSIGERQASAHLAKAVSDPELRAKLTPHFRLGCKRVLLSNDYYPALAKPNVDVVTDRIEEVVAKGLITVAPDGTRVVHEVDAIIFGTGFHVTDVPLAARLFGRDGHSLREKWNAEGMSALHGTSVAGFPNLFFLVGPNTGLGHNSIVFMIEAQLNYLLGALKSVDGTTAIEVKQQAQDTYNADIQRQLKGTVWNTGGCESWYLDKRGRNTTLWPTFTFRFRQLVRRFNPADYNITNSDITTSDITTSETAGDITGDTSAA
jgi:cation diffusion facilitator CzcD-associated flavoprotein CzcO